MSITTPTDAAADLIAHLYRDHHGWLQGWLRKKLGCSHQADDLTQDTFLRILKSWHRNGNPGLAQPRAYLTTVAKGVMVNWLQRQALERAWLDALAALPETQAPPPEQRLIILETLHEIDALLDALPPRAKQAFLLSQIEGMKYEDIARQLEVSLVTVKRYMKQSFLQCLQLMP